MNTLPEAPETIEAQLEWLREGKRQAVLLTPGTAVPVVEDTLSVTCVKEGIVLFRSSARFTKADIWMHSKLGTLGDLLGYGVPCKPNVADVSPSPGGEGRGEGGPQTPARPQRVVTRVVTVRDQFGVEKQAVVADSERLDDALEAAHQVKGAGDTVQLENGQRVIEDRLRSLDQRELRVRPYHHQHDDLALQQAAKEDAHHPLNPTHVIERGEEIVGYFGIDSLPLYRLWFHSEKMKAADSLRLLFLMENIYRMRGVPVIGTIIATSSPFYAVAGRGGYLESTNDRLFLKDL